LTEICSNRQIATTIANSPKLKVGQEVIHDALQTLQYDLVDMNTPYSNIEEDMKFPNVLIVKPNFWKIS
jgi:hypothetical protein